MNSCSDKRSSSRTVKVPVNETDPITTLDGGNSVENDLSLHAVSSGNDSDSVVGAKVLSDGTITYIKLNSLEVQTLRPSDTVLFDMQTHRLSDTGMYLKKAAIFTQK
ncbi:MAG: hypothetical protein H7329_18255 [Opitutaceae bacterium]|nr:hypothetical protein [Cytophagales bacterium]